MEKELIINANPTQVEIAIIENGKLVELHFQKTNTNFTVGDIFLGKVKKLMPSLNAAFVDIGHKRDAFLHYTDLGPQLRSLIKYTSGAMSGGMKSPLLDNFKNEADIIKTGKIEQVLSKGQPVLIQILKEPISTKGPRLSCEITLPGRYLILTPFADRVSVSKKISNQDDRKRLQVLVESIKPKGFGLIVRTAAEGKKVQDLHEEVTTLMQQWESIHKQLHNAKPPIKLLSELDKTSSILRDFLSDSFSKIVVNEKELHTGIKTYLDSIGVPKTMDIVSLYKGTKPVFETYGVTKQIKASFGKTATMNSGAYLVIDHTEAMHVIDVNSGHKVSGSGDMDNAIFHVNMEAAEEIARQVRLRDIGGLIVVDFIDMKNAGHKNDLMKAMQDFMQKDRAQHTILPLSKFGLMQITRQRVRPEIEINTSENCPSCNGSGKINSSTLLIDDIERDLEFVLDSRPKVKLYLSVNPYIYAYLRQGFPSLRMKWYMKYNRWIKLTSVSEFTLMEYRFFDENEDEIRL